MSPQFVDYNADGKDDIVVGTFDGSPHVALAEKDSWKKPVHILDQKGQRIMMNQFWDYEKRKWLNTDRCNPAEHKSLAGHLTSAWAWDHDGDGDLDLLLGDYDQGHVFVRVNDGTRTEPKFRERNEMLEAGGSPIAVGKVSTLRMLDWDGDGDQDLVVSTAGKGYGDGKGGAVHLFLNEGSKEKASFSAGIEILPSLPKENASEPKRPETGFYVDFADTDGDQDLDMVVGGYSWIEKKRHPFVWFYENTTNP